MHDDNLLSSSIIRQLIRWSLEYFGSYAECPGNNIREIYQRQASDLSDEDRSLAKSILQEASGEVDRNKYNHEFALDKTGEYQRERRIKILQRDMRNAVVDKDYEAAEHLIASYRKSAKPQVNGINPLDNVEAIIEAFEKQADFLFTLPGALGRMMNAQLVRSKLIGIQAPEKRGKTFLLYDLGKRALRARNNVVIFQAGDLDQDDSIIRQHVSISGIPVDIAPGTDILIPIADCARNQYDECTLKFRKSKCSVFSKKSEDDEEGIDPEEAGKEELYDHAPLKYNACTACRGSRKYRKQYKPAVWYEKRHFKEPLTWRQAYAKSQRFLRRMKGKQFRLFTYPADTLSVDDIDRQLAMLEAFEGFVPDVVIIDYADILAGEKGVEKRIQEDTKWKRMRKLSQDWKCLVLVATQADVQAHMKRSQSMLNFSESKTKYAHVNGMIALNQTPEEKRKGIMRWAWLVLRKGGFDVQREVTVTQCLEIARPILDAF